ncbi:T9SS type A sorting domain-containing protein [Tenacibaculum sp. 190524A02b]|uniref:T9SS type A sorting domain-containing protein n=1 Tax=Tenacibaculum vairaonense TaxID=3137860 RepID=A0ABP1FEN1_9FLAO
MKKITPVIFFMFMVSLGYAQVFPIDFSETADENFDPFNGAATSYEADPNDANNKVLKIVGANHAWDGAGLVLKQFIDLSDDNNNTITFRINPLGTGSGTSGNHLLKFEGPNGNTELAFTTTGTGWQNISLDFGSGLSHYSKIVIFTDAGDANTGNDDAFLVDDFDGGVVIAATCSDGLQNGDEEGVDCGGSCANACTISEPATAAPVPTRDETTMEVLSIYSDTYTDVVGTNFNPGWGQATTFSEVMIESNNTIKLAGLNYQGNALGSAIDVSGKTHMHIDFWAKSSTDLGIFLINSSAVANPAAEKEYLLIPSGTVETWNSVDIPLSSFSDVVDLTKVDQLKYDGNGNIWIDNIYFYKEPTAGVEEREIASFSVYPNPSSSSWNIKMKYSIINDVVVYNILGKKMMTLSNINKDKVSIPVTELNSGVYFAKVKMDHEEKTIKLIKK